VQQEKCYRKQEHWERKEIFRSGDCSSSQAGREREWKVLQQTTEECPQKDYHMYADPSALAKLHDCGQAGQKPAQSTMSVNSQKESLG